MGQHLEGWLPQSKFQQIQEIPWAINGQRLGRIRERRCICLPWSYCFLGNCLGLLLEMKCCWGGLQAGVSTARLGLRGSNRQPVLQVSQFLVQILLQHKGGRFLLFIMSSLCVCLFFFKGSDKWTHQERRLFKEALSTYSKDFIFVQKMVRLFLFS